MKSLAIVLLVLIVFPSVGKEITRQALLEGLQIPEKRNFPIDESISPCADFHKYACSKVETAFKMPEDRSYWAFSFVDNAEKLLHAKKQYFRLLSEGFEPKSSQAKPLKPLYLSCMNEKAGARDEKSFAAGELVLFQGTDSWENLVKLSVSRMDQPDFALVSFDVAPNQKNPLKLDALFMTHLMTLPERSYYDKKELMQDFEHLVQSFFTALEFKDAAARAKSVVEFEKEFAKYFPLPSELRQIYSSNTYLPRDQWTKKYKQLGLEPILARVPAESRIRDFTPKAMAWLQKALTGRPIEQLKNVYLFHQVSGHMDDAYPEFFKEYFAFQHKYMGGPAVRPIRQERCTRQLMAQYGRELDNELIPILFPSFDEKAVVELAESVRNSVLEGLEHNTWLSKTAKKEAILKIRDAKLFLVKPKSQEEWYFNPELSYSPDLPFENRRKLKKALIERDIRELTEGRSAKRWEDAPLSVNAYYSPSDNKFTLLLGILQSPFFVPEAAPYENTAAIGSVVGHELGHAIDDMGSKYDSKGSLRSWMTAKDLATFKKRTAPLIARFNAAGHDGALTLGENIGDLVGLHAAYQAAFGKKIETPKEEKQKFFLAYARNWCSVVRPELENLLLKTDPHALGAARINEQVIHQNGFYEAYGCKLGDKLYLAPEKRIRVW